MDKGKKREKGLPQAHAGPNLISNMYNSNKLKYAFKDQFKISGQVGGLSFIIRSAYLNINS